MRIKDILKNKGLTAKQVAASYPGLTESMISNAANRRTNTSLQTLEKIADALDVSIAELFTEIEDDDKIVAFLHYNGESRTPGTIAEIMDVLAEWKDEELHSTCHKRSLMRIKDKYLHDETAVKMVESLCDLLGIDFNELN